MRLLVPLVLRLLFRLSIPSMRMIRLSVYFFFVFGMLAVVSARSVYADAREAGLGVGRELATLEDLTHGASVVWVNGAEMHWASTRTAQSVDEVLARYERYCRESPSALGAAMSDLPAALEDRLPLAKGDPARAAIVREGADERGMVACFVDAKPEGTGAGGLRGKLEAFARSGDLRELGRFRYVFAERRPRDTRVVTLWSDGPLVPAKMFPASGDAPGSDPMFAPRPAESRRTLTASIEGFPAGVRVYESGRAPEEILAEADAALRRSGFEKVQGIAARGTSAFVRADGAEVILTVSRVEGEGARTSVGIVETGASLASIVVEK